MVRIDQRAYGLQFRGLPRVPELVAAEDRAEDAGLLTVTVSTTSRAGPAPYALDADRSVRRLADGHVLDLERDGSRATFHGPALDASSLAHPYLGPVATTFNRWSGREAFHAGAFVVGGRAWAVLGPRTAGKSSLLAALAARGATVLSDDVVVTDGRVVFAGPRCLDLREPLPSGRAPLARARAGTRWRLALPPVRDSVPLGGWVHLGWGPEVVMRPMAAALSLARLASGRTGRGLESDPNVLLALATFPSWVLQRPRDWGALERTLDLVCSTVSATPTGWTPPQPVGTGRL